VQSPVYTTHDQLPDDSLMSKHASVLQYYNVYTACRNKKAAFTSCLKCFPELFVAIWHLWFRVRLQSNLITGSSNYAWF